MGWERRPDSKLNNQCDQHYSINKNTLLIEPLLIMEPFFLAFHEPIKGLIYKKYPSNI